MANNAVSIRTRDNKQENGVAFDAFVERISDRIAKRSPEL